jgi:hypothetical protein
VTDKAADTAVAQRLLVLTSQCATPGNIVGERSGSAAGVASACVVNANTELVKGAGLNAKSMEDCFAHGSILATRSFPTRALCTNLGYVTVYVVRPCPRLRSQLRLAAIVLDFRDLEAARHARLKKAFGIVLLGRGTDLRYVLRTVTPQWILTKNQY